MSSSINSIGGGFNYTQMIQKMQDRFKAIDTDSNGQISKAEMQAARQSQISDTTTGASGMQVQSIMGSLLSSTGLAGTTTTQDAMSTLQTVLENMASKGTTDNSSAQQSIQDQFSKADTNGDGSLSQDEFQAAKQANGSRHHHHAHGGGAAQYEKMTSQSAQQGFQNLLDMMTSSTGTSNNDFATQFQDLLQQLGSSSSNKGDTLAQLASLISQNLPSIDMTA